MQLLGVTSPNEEELYLVMELADRGDLRTVLDRKASNLQWGMRVKLGTDAARGMKYLHKRKGESALYSGLVVLTFVCAVIHRDLKPQNLLITSNWTLKVRGLG